MAQNSRSPNRMPRLRRLAIALGMPLLLGLPCLAGCSGPGERLQSLPPAPTAYRLGPGDELRVIVAGEDQATGAFKVSDNGTIAMPLLGEVRAGGLTQPELQQRIGQQLQSAGLLRHPSVAVEITQYRPFFILGEVSKPGQFAYQPGLTVVGAVAIAGGFTYRAVTDYAAAVRIENGSAVEGRVARNTLVQPGDVITIYERRF